MGYEGVTIESFVGNLQSNHIDWVLDVRALPLSRKPGFSKSALGQRLSEAGIGYAHFAELGTPKAVRDNLKATRDYSSFFKTMEVYLAGRGSAIEDVHSYVDKQTCCLMCFEQRASKCHRMIVAEKVKARDGNGLEITHL